MSGHTAVVLHVVLTNNGLFLKSESVAGYFVEVKRVRTDQDEKADAARLAACWNACAHLTDGEVASLTDDFVSLRSERDALRAQRDALRDALQNILIDYACMNSDLRKIGKGHPWDGAHPDSAYQMAVNALAGGGK